MVLAQQSCNEIIPLLDAYFDKELSASEQEVVQTHLTNCGECTARLSKIGLLVYSLQSLPRTEMSRDITESVPLPQDNLVALRPRILAVAGIAAAVALVALVTFKGSSVQPPQVADKPAQAPIHSIASQAPHTQAPALQANQSSKIAAASTSAGTHQVSSHPTQRVQPVTASSGVSGATHIASNNNPAAVPAVIHSTGSATSITNNYASGTNGASSAGQEGIEVAVISDDGSLVDAFGMSTDEDGLYELKM